MARLYSIHYGTSFYWLEVGQLSANNQLNALLRLLVATSRADHDYLVLSTRGLSSTEQSDA